MIPSTKKHRPSCRRHRNIDCCCDTHYVLNQNIFRIARSISVVCLILLLHFLRVADASAAASGAVISVLVSLSSSSSSSSSKMSTSPFSKKRTSMTTSSDTARRRNLQQQQQMNDDTVVIAVDKTADGDSNDGFVLLDNFEQLEELSNAATFAIQQLLQAQQQQQQQQDDPLLLDRYTFLPLSNGVVVSTSISYQPQIVLAFQKVTRGVYWKLLFKIVLNGDDIDNNDNNNGSDNICVGSLEVVVHFLGDYTIDEWREEYTCEEAEQIAQGNYVIVVVDDEEEEGNDNMGSDPSRPGGTNNNIDTSFTKCCYERIENFNGRSDIVNAAWFAVQQLQRDDVTIVWPELVDDGYYSFLPLDSYEKYSYQPYILEAYQQVVGGSNWKLKLMILSEPPPASSSSSTSSMSQRQQQQRGDNVIHAINADTCIGVFEVLIYNDYGDLSITEWGKESSCEDEFDDPDDDDDPVSGGGGGGDTGNVNNNNNKSGTNEIPQSMLFHSNSIHVFILMMLMISSSLIFFLG